MIFSLVFESFLRSPSRTLTVDQYRLHMQMHRKRVKHLALLLVRTFPDEFPGVTESLVGEFLDLHDLSKVDDSYSSHDPISRRLSETFGKDQYLPDVQDTISLAVAELNMIDQEIAKNFFKEKGLLLEDPHDLGEVGLTSTAKMLLRIENIADLVDRGFDKIAHIEFGRPLARASEFLPVVEDRLMAQHLEMIYNVEVAKIESENSEVILRELFRSSQ